MCIRTKDDVYEVVDTYGVKYVIGYNEDGFEVTIYKDQVINKSENLEKLCDDFVGLIKDRNSDFIITKVIAHSLKELKDSLKTELNGKVCYSKFDIIYGCIWTDWGLKYIAKMNSEGKLVLI